MVEDNEVRFKTPRNIHVLWSHAAELRGLSLKGFITSVINAELIRTGELVLTPPEASSHPATSAPKPKATSLASENAAFEAERARQLAEGNVWYRGQWVAKEIADAHEAKDVATPAQTRKPVVVDPVWLEDDDEELNYGD